MPDSLNVSAPPSERKTKTDEGDILTEALRRFDVAWTTDQDNRNEALEDLKFAAGEQWPSQILSERRSEGRPALTINRMPQFIRQIVGDIRQNKPAIKVRPAGGDADAERAELLTGFCRHIELQSDADTAYVTAVESAARCGMGHWRIVTQYSNDDAFEQDIRIKRITDPFAVLWDPDCEEWDKSDARYCFVTNMIPVEEFKALYPDAVETDFESAAATLVDRTTDATVWYREDRVRICEYWKKVPDKRTIYLLGDGSVTDKAPDGAPVNVVKTREVTVNRVEQYVLSGQEVLEGPNEWPGKHFPIVTVLGEEVNVGERVIRYGMVRHAKDAQRTFNYMRSASVETVALQPKAPFVATADQVAGYEEMWKSAGTKNYGVLIYRNDPQSPGPPQRQMPPTVSQGFLAETGLAAEDMKATTGVYDAALGNRSNETSGKAILARQREADVGTFAYVDNLSRAIRHSGQIIIDLIPHIYDTERVIRIVDEDGEESEAQVNQPQMMVGDDGQAIWSVLNDITVGEYDVAVTVGPSYTTKRIEAAESMMQFMQAVPQAAALVADLFAKSMDWPGSEKIAKRLAKTLPPGIDDENPQPPPQPPPDPRMVKVQADAQRDQGKLQIEAGRLQLDQQKLQLQAAEAQQRGEMEQMKAQLQQLQTQIQAMVAGGDLAVKRADVALKQAQYFETSERAEMIRPGQQLAERKAEWDAQMARQRPDNSGA